MRTDRIMNAAALAAAVMLGASLPALAQDTLQAGGGTPASALRHTGNRVVVGSDVRIARDEVVDGKVVVTGGDVVVDGRVTGNVTVVRGNLRLEPGSAVEGSVEVTGGSVANAGVIDGDARVVGGRLVNENQGRILGEMRVEGAEHRSSSRGHSETTQAVHFTRFGSFGDGLSGLFSTLAMGIILAGIGGAAVFYARPQLDMVSDSVRRDTLRAGALGVATGFLVLPAYVIGIVILALTIIGIPLLLVFAPLFPVAVVALAACGLVAVAHALGERTAARRGGWDAPSRNSYSYVFTGVAVLLAPLVVADLLKMTVFLGFAGSFLEWVAKAGLWLAAAVGIGALLMTRGGMGARWRWGRRAPAYDPIFDGPVSGNGSSDV